MVFPGLFLSPCCSEDTSITIPCLEFKHPQQVRSKKSTTLSILGGGAEEENDDDDDDSEDMTEERGDDAFDNAVAMSKSATEREENSNAALEASTPAKQEATTDDTKVSDGVLARDGPGASEAPLTEDSKGTIIDGEIRNTENNIREIESEFQRMTQNADRILESIRKEQFSDEKTRGAQLDMDDYDEDMREEIERLGTASDEIRLLSEVELPQSMISRGNDDEGVLNLPSVAPNDDDMNPDFIQDDDIISEIERVGKLTEKVKALNESFSSEDKNVGTPSNRDYSRTSTSSTRLTRRVSKDDKSSIDRKGSTDSYSRTKPLVQGSGIVSSLAGCAPSTRNDSTAAMEEIPNIPTYDSDTSDYNKLSTTSSIVAGNSILPIDRAVTELCQLSKANEYDAAIPYRPPPPRERQVMKRQSGRYDEGMDMVILAGFGTVWAIVAVLMDHVRVNMLNDEGHMNFPTWPFTEN